MRSISTATAARDICNSVPDALASAAKQLVGKGWQRGKRWAYEVRAPENFDCTHRGAGVTKPMGEWLQLGFVPAYGRKLSARNWPRPRRCCMPAGLYGPAFLTPKNYFVIKEYNFSDLYVLFVGQLADRIAGGRGVRDAVGQGRAAQAPRRSRRCSAADRRCGSIRTRSTARPG